MVIGIPDSCIYAMIWNILIRIKKKNFQKIINFENIVLNTFLIFKQTLNRRILSLKSKNLSILIDYFSFQKIIDQEFLKLVNEIKIDFIIKFDCKVSCFCQCCKSVTFDRTEYLQSSIPHLKRNYFELSQKVNKQYLRDIQLYKGVNKLKMIKQRVLQDMLPIYQNIKSEKSNQ